MYNSWTKGSLHLDELPLEVLEGEIARHLDDLSFTLFRITHGAHLALFPLADKRNLRKDRFLRECIRQGDLKLFLWARTECRCPLSTKAFAEILHCRRNSLDLIEYFAPLIDETMEKEGGWQNYNLPMYRGIIALQRKRFLTQYQYACLLALTKAEDSETYPQERVKRHIRPEYFPKIIDPDFALEEMAANDSLEFFMFQSMLKSILPLDPELYPSFSEELKAAVSSNPSRKRFEYLISNIEPVARARYSMLLDLFFAPAVEGVSFIARWAVANLNLPQLRSIYMNYVLILLCGLNSPLSINTFKFLISKCKANGVTLKSNGLGFEDYDFVRPALRNCNLPILRIILDENLVDIEPEIGTHYFGPVAVMYVFKSFQRLQEDAKMKKAFDSYLAAAKKDEDRGDRIFQTAAEFGVEIDEGFTRYLESMDFVPSPPVISPRSSTDRL